MKHEIQVRKKDGGQVLTTVRRTLRAEQIGNFNPIFCQYNYESHLVKSDEGDLSDPFRREKSYLKTLYIEI